jgi:hypothetical protein
MLMHAYLLPTQLGLDGGTSIVTWPDIKANRLVNKGGMLNVDQLLLIDYLSEYNPKYF